MTLNAVIALILRFYGIQQIFRPIMSQWLKIIIIIIIIITLIPRILASASNAPKQPHCQTGKSLAVYRKLQKSQWNVS